LDSNRPNIFSGLRAGMLKSEKKRCCKVPPVGPLPRAASPPTEHSKASDFHTFVAKKWGVQSGPNSDIAKLRGARFVSATEGERGQKLAESLIEQLTGGDTISECFKFKEPFEFKPQLKL
jgi:hypothetical protein